MKRCIFLICISIALTGCFLKSEKPPLVVGVDIDFAQNTTVSGTPRLYAYLLDIAQEIGKKVNRKVDVRHVASVDIFSSLSKGDIDCVLSSRDVPLSLSRQYIVSVPLVYTGCVLVTRNSTPVIQPNDTVVTNMKNHASFPLFLEENGHIIESVSTPQQALYKVQKEGADVAVIGSLEANELLTPLAFSELKAISKPSRAFGIRFIFSSHFNPNDAQQICDEVNSMVINYSLRSKGKAWGINL